MGVIGEFHPGEEAREAGDEFLDPAGLLDLLRLPERDLDLDLDLDLERLGGSGDEQRDLSLELEQLPDSFDLESSESSS